MQIGYVRVAFEDADYAAIPAANERFKTITTERRMHNQSPETAVPDSIAPQSGDLMVRKTRVGAFSTTDLDRQLKDHHIDTLILGGISTSGVVLTTVREAADRDYRLFVLADGCADTDQSIHDFLMQKIFPRQATILSIAELSDRLRTA